MDRMSEQDRRRSKQARTPAIRKICSFPSGAITFEPGVANGLTSSARTSIQIKGTVCRNSIELDKI